MYSVPMVDVGPFRHPYSFKHTVHVNVHKWQIYRSINKPQRHFWEMPVFTNFWPYRCKKYQPKKKKDCKAKESIKILKGGNFSA